MALLHASHSIAMEDRHQGPAISNASRPSERYASERGLRHKKLTDWARQGMLQTIRWLPDRKVIFVGDSSFGTHELANSISKHGTLISRLREAYPK